MDGKAGLLFESLGSSRCSKKTCDKERTVSMTCLYKNG